MAVMIVLIVLLVTIAAHTDAADECGRRQSQNNHEKSVQSGDWPWHVALMHRINGHPSYACGGTIIARRLVLTAAHCTYPQSRGRMLHPKDIFVRAGTPDLRRVVYPLQKRDVAQIIRHDYFNLATQESDLAMLQLTADLLFNDFVRPICLWRGSEEEEMIVGAEGHVPVRGNTKMGTQPKESLQHAIMSVVSRRTCKQSDPDYYPWFIFDRTTFCVESRNGVSPGFGDSGAGLYIESGGIWMLRGLLNNAKLDIMGTLDTNDFFVFTDVAYYLPSAKILRWKKWLSIWSSASEGETLYQ